MSLAAGEMERSVSKALNPQEKPLDAQQARTIILLTHRLKEANSFWRTASRQSLTISRFSAWKFCNLLHRVLRYGHPQAMHDSQCQRRMLQQIAAYWLPQPLPMGRCIALYSGLLLLKLNFHAANPYFTGCLQLVDNRHWDVNVCFQLCSDLLDLLEQCLLLQQAVFNVAHAHRMEKLSSESKCRLLPLLTVAEECAALYEQFVAFLHCLCAMLPLEDVAGLRERFYMLFTQLQYFQLNLQDVPYLADFLTTTTNLPTAPNFYASPQYIDYANMPTAPLESELHY